MAVDFSNLLKKKSGEAKRPKHLPVGTYPGKIKSFEYGDKNKNNTPYVRFHLAATSWPETVDASDQVEDDGRVIDLSKKRLRRDIYLTEDALHILDEFLKSCGQELGASYEEVIPKCVGSDVLIDVGTYVNQQSSEIENQVNKIVGVQ